VGKEEQEVLTAKGGKNHVDDGKKIKRKGQGIEKLGQKT